MLGVAGWAVCIMSAKFWSNKDGNPIDEQHLWKYDPEPLRHDGTNEAAQVDVVGAKQLYAEDFDKNNQGLIKTLSGSSSTKTFPALPFDPGEFSRANKLLYFVELRMLDIWGSLKYAFSKERDFGSLFNFVPVCFASGIGAYFFITNEPSMFAIISAALVTGLGGFRLQSRGAQFSICVSSCLFFSGMLAAQLQVRMANTPVPKSGITGQLHGLVLSVDQNQRGAPRYVIRPVEVEGLGQNELPKKIRLSASKKHTPFEPGDSIKGLARIAPISGPAYPGGYDFSFPRWMQGMGLSGFFMGAPSNSEVLVKKTITEEIAVTFQSTRASIGMRIRAGLPGEAGDIAVALITGDRSGLSKETQETLRRSGLAHILAISGLHMALVTLTVIWVFRLILVFIPGMSERASIKKWAFGVGFVTATLYMGLSGASIATQRAWLMITVMLMASLMDRRAITMRSVTIAALIILVIDPASLFQPGFQMSFAAVAALVAVYQDWTRQKRQRSNKIFEQSERFGAFGGIKAIGGYFVGLSATSLIAGSATMLFALWHFHRVVPLGLVSNLIAMPLVSMLVMPLSLLSVFLMPYGFEAVALAPLGLAIDKVVAAANLVNSYEYDFETGARPVGFLLASATFLITVTFLRTRLRWLAVFPLLVVGNLSQSKPPLPDILIAQDGRNIAVRTYLLVDADGKSGLTLLYPRRGKFITDIWQRAFIPNQVFDKRSKDAACGKEICRMALGTQRLVIVQNPKLIAEACVEADILIAPRLWWTNCREEKPSLILNRTNLEQNGAHAVYDLESIPNIVTSWPNAGKDLQRRAWMNRFDNVSRRFPAQKKPDKNVRN